MKKILTLFLFYSQYLFATSNTADDLARNIIHEINNRQDDKFIKRQNEENIDKIYTDNNKSCDKLNNYIKEVVSSSEFNQRSELFQLKFGAVVD